ncbi:MAG: Mor transcription activator family protein [Comamonas sp.]
MSDRNMTSAEAAILDGLLPVGMTPDMRDVAMCLYEALVLNDCRAGQVGPSAEWLAQLNTWANQVLMQLQRLADQKGGHPLYIAKGIAVHLTARDRTICAGFRGNNYRELARKNGLTEMRVRQIVDAFQREQFLRRQGNLPGFDGNIS